MGLRIEEYFHMTNMRVMYSRQIRLCEVVKVRFMDENFHAFQFMDDIFHALIVELQEIIEAFQVVRFLNFFDAVVVKLHIALLRQCKQQWLQGSLTVQMEFHLEHSPNDVIRRGWAVMALSSDSELQNSETMRFWRQRLKDP